MTKTQKKAILISIITVLSLLAVTGVFFAGLYGSYYSLSKKYSFKNYSEATGGGDKIHFIDVGSGDAIVLESQGKFAMIDAGEDTANPRGFDGLKLDGHEQTVINYLNKYCSKNGEVELEFIIGTHSHSDHIGAFNEVLAEKNITAKRAYLKKYYADRISDMEVEEWDNQEMYDDMIAAVKAKNIPLTQDLVDLKLTLGNFNLTIFNGQEPEVGKKVGENENSIAILADNGKMKTLLTGDMNNLDGDEVRVGKEVGRVNILKLGHHGFKGSSSSEFVGLVNPDIAIQTIGFPADFGVKFAIGVVAQAPMYSSVKHNGIVIDVTETMVLFDKSCANLA